MRKVVARARGERGFTLLEILIVLAVLGVLAAIVVPNVAGFVTQSKDRAWRTDQRLLQAAVDAYRTDLATSTSGNPPPFLSGANLGGATAAQGTPVDANDDGDTNSFIDIGLLATSRYIKGSEAVRSANKTFNATAAQAQSGSYAWYVDAEDIVRSWYKGGNGNNVVDAAEKDFVSGVFP